MSSQQPDPVSDKASTLIKFYQERNYKYSYRNVTDDSNPLNHLSPPKKDSTFKRLCFRKDGKKDGVALFNLASLKNKTSEKLLKKQNLDPSQYKLVFVTRHAEAAHNINGKTFGKGVYHNCFGEIDNVDPKLSEAGKDEAAALGNAMKGFNLPRPDRYFTSSLSRCIHTALITSQHLYGEAKDVSVKENLREWVGWDHGHRSDQRETFAQIRDHFEGLGLWGKIHPSQPEPDFPATDTFVADRSRELYMDVKYRMECVLDNIFDTSPQDAPRVHLFLHGRCLRYFLHAIGHKELFEMENCATVAFFVRREYLSDADKARIAMEYPAQAQREWQAIMDEIEANKKRARKDFEEIVNVDPKKVEKGWNLLRGHDAQRQKWIDLGGLPFER